MFASVSGHVRRGCTALCTKGVLWLCISATCPWRAHAFNFPQPVTVPCPTFPSPQPEDEVIPTLAQVRAAEAAAEAEAEAAASGKGKVSSCAHGTAWGSAACLLGCALPRPSEPIVGSLSLEHMRILVSRHSRVRCAPGTTLGAQILEPFVQEFDVATC